MDVYLIRHGLTKSNRELRYLGRTDEPLSDEGRAGAEHAGRFPAVRAVATSPMLRTRQTAGILFPGAELIVYDGFREMDFGDFEGRLPDELAGDADYLAWVSAECALPCPGGETAEGFLGRCEAALISAVRDACERGDDRLIVVTHGGVIMTLMQRYSGDAEKTFFDWYPKNCAGYRASLDASAWDGTGRFTEYAPLTALSF